MKIQKQIQEHVLTLKPLGRIDTTTAPELAAAVELEEISKIVFDLSEVDYVSSAGLRVFLAAHQNMAARSGSMVITGAKPIVMDIFDIAGFTDTFQFA